MDGPQIICPDLAGIHNADLSATVRRLDGEAQWKDLSTIIMVPAANSVPTKVVASWMSLVKPPNNKCIHLWATGTEVGEAYSRMIEAVLGDPNLREWKYLLTLEHDNAPPPDGLVKLQQRMEKHPEYTAIGGLYFTKGHGGVAQIWGDPHSATGENFRPQRPDPAGGLVECCGTGMGFTLFRLSMFRDEKLRRPWFKTVAGREGVGTQDLYAWGDFRKHGYRCAIDCSVKVGHYDAGNDLMW